MRDFVSWENIGLLYLVRVPQAYIIFITVTEANYITIICIKIK